MKSTGKLIVIFGPPASGKDSVMKGLLKIDELNLKKLVTYTTRPRRENETQGYDYHFVTPAKFFELIDKGEIIEYELHGSHWKGAPLQPFKEILGERANYIWRVTNYRGGTLHDFIKSKFDKAESKKLIDRSVTIHIGPNDKKILKSRYMSRTSNPSEKEFEKRYEEDMESWDRFKDHYDHVLKNEGTLKETIDEAAAIVKAL